jgi:predicted acylesterase/phospholipase RssA
VGALQALEENGVLAGIVRVAGTSAGSITAMCVALGDTAAQTRETAMNQNMKDFADGGLLISKAARIYTKYGMHPGRKLEEWLRQAIKDRTGNPDLTFAQLHRLTQAPFPASGRRFRDLYVVGTSIADHLPVVFSWEDSPDLPIATAVRISSAIPVFFQAVRLASEEDPVRSSSQPHFTLSSSADGEASPEVARRGSLSKKKSKRSDKDTAAGLFVDGGLCWNLPIGIFDTSDYTASVRRPTNPPNAWMKKKLKTRNASYVFNYDTLGLSLLSQEELNIERDQYSACISSVRLVLVLLSSSAMFASSLHSFFSFFISLISLISLISNDFE